MSEAMYRRIVARFEEIKRECDTPEKARQYLQSIGMLDENGETAAMYRETREDSWQ